MTSAQVVETSVKVTRNSPFQDYTHPDDHNLRTYDMTPGFKPFTVILIYPLYIVYCNIYVFKKTVNVQRKSVRRSFEGPSLTMNIINRTFQVCIYIVEKYGDQSLK